jgi:hypothetical protein
VFTFRQNAAVPLLLGQSFTVCGGSQEMTVTVKASARESRANREAPAD